MERNNTSRRSTQTRIHYIEASSLSVVRSRETVPKEQDKKKKGLNKFFGYTTKQISKIDS